MIVTTCERMNWLLQWADGFSFFTDHTNLLYIFNPYGSKPGICSHTTSKRILWALNFSSYRYVIGHVKGEDNIWTELMTRCVATSSDLTVARTKTAAVCMAPIEPFDNDSFWLPSINAMKQSQPQNMSSQVRKN